MKFFIFFILALNILNATAQKKISFDLFFDAGMVFSQSKPVTKSSPGVMSYDPNTGASNYTPGTFKSINEYKNIIAPKISLGVNANYILNYNFKIYGGVSISYLNARRENTVILPIPLSANQNYNYTSTEIFNFYNLDIPLGITYSQKKWLFNLGIIQSVILNSGLDEIKKPVNSEIEPLPPAPVSFLAPPPSPDNEKKSFISLSVSPLYQLSNKVKIGLAYNHALTNSYSTNWYSQDLYQRMKTNSLGLKIFYKLN